MGRGEITKDSQRTLKGGSHRGESLRGGSRGSAWETTRNDLDPCV